MEKKFKIEMPDIPNEDKEEIRAKNRGMFTQDMKSEGALGKSLIFTYQNEPTTITEVSNKINLRYGTDFDRARIYRDLMKLVNKGILNMADVAYVYTLSPEERTHIHNEILRKHQNFLSKIPKQFRSKFQNVNYFWVSNGEGIHYIEWCCKLLGFKVK